MTVCSSSTHAAFLHDRENSSSGSVGQTGATATRRRLQREKTPFQFRTNLLVVHTRNPGPLCFVLVDVLLLFSCGSFAQPSKSVVSWFFPLASLESVISSHFTDRPPEIRRSRPCSNGHNRVLKARWGLCVSGACAYVHALWCSCPLLAPKTFV